MYGDYPFEIKHYSGKMKKLNNSEELFNFFDEILTIDFKQFINEIGLIKQIKMIWKDENKWFEDYLTIDFYIMFNNVIEEFMSLINLRSKLNVKYDISIIKTIKEEYKDILEKFSKLNEFENKIKEIDELWEQKKYDDVFMDACSLTKQIIKYAFQVNSVELKKVNNKNFDDYAKATKELLKKVIGEKFLSLGEINGKLSNFFTGFIVAIRNKYKPENDDSEMRKEFNSLNDKNKRIFSQLYINICKIYMNIFILCD
ncbi:hypothetical protein [Spiroplasma endosymbiont of Amphibalanus improvisus]|uniref:hypothetical protein n=1 Tax=Spiroplasma endosymbiont of Amphibalanus improvisus TaxID=3066327 RepID=UPI00313C9D22